METEEIKAHILYKLHMHHKWGASHTSFDNLYKGFKLGFGKEIKRAAEELITEGFIIKKPTQYGLEVSLNPRMSKEIKDIIAKTL